MADVSGSRLVLACLVLAHVSACAKDAAQPTHRDAAQGALADSQATPCRDAPEKLVQLSGRWTALAVGQDAIYLGKDAIWRMPKRAVPELQHFAASPAPVAKLVVHGDRVFWLVAPRVGQAGALFAAGTSGGPSAAVPGEPDATPALEATAVALTTSQAFVFAAFRLATDRFQIVRVRRMGTTAEKYVEIQARSLLGLAADDEQVYVSTDEAIGAWNDRGEVRSTQQVGAELLADEAFIYFRQDDAERGRLVRASKDTLEPQALIELPSTDRLKLATATGDAYIHWTDESGTISRAPKDGGAGEPIATTGEYDDDDFDTLLAVDGTSVYWVGGESGTRASDDAPIWLYRICK